MVINLAKRITIESALLDIAHEHRDMIDKPITERMKSRAKAYKRAEFIYENGIDVLVEVANNEQKGYSAKELQLPIAPMKTKKETGERQTADYIVKWKWKTEPDSAYRKMGIIFERKALEDFHGTVISNYDRFNAEIDRFLDDPNTRYMFILVEASRAEALTYRPQYKRYTGDQIKRMIGLKLSVIASIQTRGIQICWQGSRQASANSIKDYVEHFFKKNYDFVLRKEIGLIWLREEVEARLKR